MRKHIINLEAAIKMTALYRQQRENILSVNFKGKDILPLYESIDRSAIDTLLREQDCKSVRIYYGMSDDFTIRAILVGVNSGNEDILPTSSTSEGLEGEPVILDETLRCPPFCPPPDSPLNQ